MAENLVYFVWLNSCGKLFPQKWYQDMLNSHNKKPMHSDDVLKFKTELSDQERNLTLNELIVKYPAPVQPKEIKNAS